jgi:hypothetical protein
MALVTAEKDGAERIRDESGAYVARYRNGYVVELSTGCRDRSAAQSVLADLARKGERVRPTCRGSRRRRSVPASGRGGAVLPQQ